MSSYKILTIANGEQNSNELALGPGGPLRHDIEMEIIAPATMPETVTLQVKGPAGNWADQRTALQDFIIAAGKADFCTVLMVDAIRFRAGSAVGDDRAIEVMWRPKPR